PAALSLSASISQYFMGGRCQSQLIAYNRALRSSLLRNLGRDQASFMIDAFLRDAQAVFQHERDKLAAAQRRAVGIALSVLLAIAAICMVVWMVVTLIRTSSSMPPKPVAVESQAAQRSPNGSSKSSVRTTPPDAIVDQVSVGSSTSPLATSSPSDSENSFDLKVGATVSLNRDCCPSWFSCYHFGGMSPYDFPRS